MKNYKKLVLSLLILLIIVPIIYSASSDSNSLSEWRMTGRTLDNNRVYLGTINMHNFRGIESYNIMA